MSAVFLSQSASLLGRFHDRDRDYRLAADAAVELLRHPVALLENPHPNPKLTLPRDLAYAEFLLAGESAGREP